MKRQRIVLSITGKASDRIANKWDELFKIKRGSNDIILFCDYSEYDIPLGYRFTCLQKENDIIFSGNIILKAITPQFLHPLDYIPQGWQTICAFEFLGSIPDLFKTDIPAVEDWTGDRIIYRILE